MAEDSPWIIETTDQGFETDVVEQSSTRPVVVDFWAPWCGPCRQLGPILEKLAQEYAGKFTLAKVNVDREQQIAGAMGVQSIPMVVAFRDGRPVDQFAGLMPEAQLREWIDSIIPSEAEELVERAEGIESEDPATAEKCYRDALELAPHDDSIKIRLARTLAAQNRDDECRPIITELEKRGFLEPEAEAIKAQIDLRSAASEAGGVEEARKAAEANPDDLSLQLKLADALAVSGRQSEALDICLELIERDRAGIGDDAKETMVKIFEMPGTPSEVASEYRRKLSTLLY